MNAAITAAQAVVAAVGPPLAIAETATRSTKGVRLSYLLVSAERAITVHPRVLSAGKVVAGSPTVLHPARSPSAHTASLPLSQRVLHLPALTACVTATAGPRTSYPSCVPIRTG